jgi:hypothetical protein
MSRRPLTWRTLASARRRTTSKDRTRNGDGPEADGQVTDFFHSLAHTHSMRWRVARRTVGYGHVYQGRSKGFPVRSDDDLLNVLWYVDRNALGAGFVERAEQCERRSKTVALYRSKTVAPVDRC